MSKKRWLLSVVMALALCCMFAFAACETSEKENEGGGGEKTTVVSLNTASITLDRYEYGSLQATVTVDGVADPAAEIAWSSSNEGVVTVDDGQLVPKAEGSATITAASGEASATCTVTVDDSGAVPLLKHTDSIGMTLDGTYTLTPSVTYLDEDTSDAQFTYSVGTGADVVSVEDGVLTASKVGEATVTISASWRGYTAMTKNVAVKVTRDVMLELSVERVSLAPSAITLDETPYYNTAAATATVRLSGEVQDSPQITWKTSDDTVLSVADGTITAKKAGSANVWFTYSPVAGEEYSSNQVKVDVAIPVLDRTETISKDFDQVTPAALDSSDIFKEEVSVNKDITAVYDSEDLTTNLLQEGKVGTAALEAGEREFVVYNASYACRISAVVATMIIDNFTELKAFKESVNANASQGGTDGYYILNDDIQAQESYEFTGGNYHASNPWIGNGDLDTIQTNGGFRGTFDGRGHTLSGFEFGIGGIFGDLNGATVKNLNVLGAFCEKTSEEQYRANGLLGHGVDGSVIENCRFEVELVGDTLNSCAAVAYIVRGTTFDNVTMLVANNDSNCHSFATTIGTGNTYNEFVILQVGTNESLGSGTATGIDNRIIKLNASASADTIYNDQTNGTQSADLTASLLVNDTAESDVSVEWKIASGDAATLDGGKLTAASGKYGEVQVYFTCTYMGFTFTSDPVTVTVTDSVEDKTAEIELIFDLSDAQSGAVAIDAKKVFGDEYSGTVTSVVLDGDRETELLVSDTQTVNFGSVVGEQTLVVRSSDNAAYKVSAMIATMVINDLDDLQTFKTTIINNSKTTGTDGYYLLGATITASDDYNRLMGGAYYAPETGTTNNAPNNIWAGYTEAQALQTNGRGFKGVFNGNGYSLSGFSFGVGGIFGDLNGATIKNLKIENATIEAWGDWSTCEMRAITLISHLAIDSTIEDCHFTLAISQKDSTIVTRSASAIAHTIYNLTMRDVTIDITNTDTDDNSSAIAINAGGTNQYENVVVNQKGTNTQLFPNESVPAGITNNIIPDEPTEPETESEVTA